MILPVYFASNLPPSEVPPDNLRCTRSAFRVYYIREFICGELIDGVTVAVFV